MEYKNKYPQFAQVLKESKEKLIEELETTMFEMALGKRTVKETKKFIKKNKDGTSETRIEEVIKEIPPHPTLLIFSLKNLTKGVKWQDYRDTADVQVNIGDNELKESVDRLISTIKEEDSQ